MDAHFSEKVATVSMDALMEGSLRPTTSRASGRYDTNITSSATTSFYHVTSPSSKTASGSSLPRYLPPNWSFFVQPEGQPYFFRDTSLRVVTDSNLYDSETRQKVEFWTKRLEYELVEKDLCWTSSWELYVNVDGGNDCEYYFVDHDIRSQFWIGTTDIGELGLAPAVSQSHLEVALQSLYWMHVEYFPMHVDGLPRRCAEDLICVFNHGFLDQLTSEGSTFPYSPEDCQKFLKLLTIARDYPDNGHQTCLMARLQAEICNHRFRTHYGEPHVRLSRDPPLAHHKSLVARMVSIASLDIAARYSDQLDVLFIDRFVYGHKWQAFVSSCLQEWKESLIFTLLSFLLHAIFVLSPGSPLLTMTSLLLFTGSVIASTVLIVRYRPMEKSRADVAHTHLDAICSHKHRFLFAALIYSLPSALHLWGICIIVINCITSVYSHFGFIPGFATSWILYIVFLFFSRVFSSVRLPSPRSVFTAGDDLV